MRKYTLSNTTKLYHVSINPHKDGTVFYPRVPANFAEGEDTSTPRICFSTSVKGAVEGAGIYFQTLLYLYTPANYRRKDFRKHLYKPTKQEVPDVEVTREKWITCPVHMKLIGTIEIKRNKIVISKYEQNSQMV